MNKTRNITTTERKVPKEEDDATEAKDQNEIPLEKEVQTKTRKINLKILKRERNASLNQKEDIKRNKSLAEDEGYEQNVKEEHRIDKLSSDVYCIKGKLRALVDPKMMKEELKQLEDPPITPWEKEVCAARLPFSFFDKPCELLAQNLLGKVLVRQLENGTILKGRIVETEGYLGGSDKASHSYGNKVTPRNIPMYMSPGTIYVYMTYGMYHCFNISSQGDGSAVLIRAVDPLEGMEHMIVLRNSKTKSKKAARELKTYELCNGPSKLCMAFQLHKNHSKYSLCTWKGLWIEDDPTGEEIQIIKSSRIGIDGYGQEWANKPLRYYIYGNKSVSKRDKKAESLLKNT